MSHFMIIRVARLWSDYVSSRLLWIRTAFCWNYISNVLLWKIIVHRNLFLINFDENLMFLCQILSFWNYYASDLRGFSICQFNIASSINFYAAKLNISVESRPCAKFETLTRALPMPWHWHLLSAHSVWSALLNIY